MIQNPDGSIVLSPGETAPAGYSIVQQRADGSTLAINSANQTPAPVATPASGAGGIVVPALAAKQVYDLGKGLLPTAAPTGVPATPNVLSVARVPTPSFGGLTAGQITPMSGLAGAAGAYSLYNQFSKPLQGSTLGQGLQGAAGGAGVGYMVGGPVGMGIGAGIGGAVGLIRGAFGNRQNGFELMQEQVRTSGGQSGLFYRPNGATQAHMQLADGSYYNIEQGGYKDAGDSAGWSVDPNAKWGKQAVGWANVLGDAVTGGASAPEGANVYLAGSLANGALSNSNGDIEVVRANMLKQIENMGLDQAKLEAALTQLRDSGKIDQATYQWRMEDLNSLFSGEGYDARTMQEFTTRDQQTAPGSAPQSTTGPAPLPNGVAPSSRMAQNVQVGPNVQAAAQAASAMPSVGTIPAGYRAGSKAAGGIVDNRTNKWYASADQIPR